MAAVQMEKERALLSEQEEKVGLTAYLALIFAILFFSGIFGELSKVGDGQWAWLGAFDFTVLGGKFGRLGSLVEGGGTLAANFRGQGGAGSRDAFLYAVTLAPQVIFALGVVKIVEDLGALKAAQKLITPILRLVMGVPGNCAVALVTSLQSTDAGASMVKSLGDNGQINEREKLIMTAFQYTGAGTIVNYFSIGAAVMPLLEIPIYIPLCTIFICKLISGNLMRIIAGKLVK